mmetsp:Transcript_29249/g.90403  ORF Transcript_29249/g.90403 Transcript_29249/m.90403 type:complete len:84 (-) Transcript_29249:59-310(-)
MCSDDGSLRILSLFVIGFCQRSLSKSHRHEHKTCVCIFSTFHPPHHSGTTAVASVRNARHVETDTTAAKRARPPTSSFPRTKS